MENPDESVALRAALQRLLRAFEADFEKCPGMTVQISWETNSQAVEQARRALGLTPEGLRTSGSEPLPPLVREPGDQEDPGTSDEPGEPDYGAVSSQERAEQAYHGKYGPRGTHR